MSQASPASLLETVPSTKLHPPRPPRHPIVRDAMLQKLTQARGVRCILLQGPAGSGKTHVAATWRQSLARQDIDVAWLSLIADDDEPQRFCACVLASLARVDAHVVQPAAQLLERDDDPDADELWVITLVQSLSARQRPLVLVLDDVQHLRHPRVGRILGWLLEYLPAPVQLTLLTRQDLPFPTERWRAQGQLVVFGMADLRLTAQESESFLRQQWGRVSPREAARLHRISDGWISGLKLLALDPSSAQPGQAPATRVHDAPSFAEYFEREVLLQMPPADLALLMHSAIPHRFCASLCAQLLGSGDVAGVDRRLATLARTDVFVSAVPGEGREVWYRLHPLLGEVLRARLGAQPNVDVPRLHGMAWRWFDSQGAIDEAVRHAVLAGEHEAAADLVERNADRVAAVSGMAQLGVLLRRLPANVVRGRFRLRLLSAHLRLTVRDISAVEAEVPELELALASHPAPRAWQRQGLTVLRAGLAMQHDDSDAIAALQAELEAIPDDADPFDVARRGVALAWMHMNRGEHLLAEQSLQAADRADLSDERRLVGDAFRGMSLAFQGRIADAETLLRRVLDRAERRPGVDGTLVCVAAGLLSDPLYEVNDLGAVRELLEPRIELLERCVIPDILLRALIVLSSVHWTLGNRLEGLAIVQRLEDYALHHRLDRMLAHALLLRMRWELREGHLDAARILLERIDVLGDRHADAGPGTFGHLRRVRARAHAAMCLHWNQFAQAREHLHRLLASAGAAGRWREATMAHMLLTLAESGARRQDEAWRHLTEALRLAHRMGLTRTVLDASPQVPALLQQWMVRPQAQAEPLLVFHAQRVLSAADATRALVRRVPNPTATPGPVTLSDREAEVLSLVAQALPNKKIARALDITPHTVKFHLRNIYVKLGVSERDQALARWRDCQAG